MATNLESRESLFQGSPEPSSFRDFLSKGSPVIVLYSPKPGKEQIDMTLGDFAVRQYQGYRFKAPPLDWGMKLTPVTNLDRVEPPFPSLRSIHNASSPRHGDFGLVVIDTGQKEISLEHTEQGWVEGGFQVLFDNAPLTPGNPLYLPLNTVDVKREVRRDQTFPYLGNIASLTIVDLEQPLP